MLTEPDTPLEATTPNDPQTRASPGTAVEPAAHMRSRPSHSRNPAAPCAQAGPASHALSAACAVAAVRVRCGLNSGAEPVHEVCHEEVAAPDAEQHEHGRERVVSAWLLPCGAEAARAARSVRVFRRCRPHCRCTPAAVRVAPSSFGDGHVLVCGRNVGECRQ